MSESKFYQRHLSKELQEMEAAMLPFNGIADRLVSAALKIEENIWKDVMRQLLKREPTVDDAKNTMKIIYPGECNQYHLAYGNLELGIVKTDYGTFDEPTFHMTFIPHSEPFNPGIL